MTFSSQPDVTFSSEEKTTFSSIPDVIFDSRKGPTTEEIHSGAAGEHGAADAHATEGEHADGHEDTLQLEVIACLFVLLLLG